LNILDSRREENISEIRTNKTKDNSNNQIILDYFEEIFLIYFDEFINNM